MSALLLCVAVTAATFGVALAAPASAETRTPHADVTISTDKEFDKAHAVRSGSGTHDDPYVISGWQIGSLVIQNTSRYVTIRNNTIGGLVLDWIGNRIDVRDNTVGDLRVNQNVPRTGAPTSGRIAWNAFRVVGQLRHWDGVFERNVVGTPQNIGGRAVNFDGFNGAQFRDNTIYGFVDARLHGHHHSSSFGSASHNHAATHDHGHHAAAPTAMHRHRYHRVTIAANRITADHEYALAFLDTDHAANDRTAASETDPDLELPHLHYTHVHVMNNQLEGSGLLVNVFNAPDERHPWTERGLVHISENHIALGPDSVMTLRQLQGIEVRRAKDIDLRIVGNVIDGQKDAGPLGFLEEFDQDAGIFLNTFDIAGVQIIGNRVSDRVYGVRAANLTESVRWVVRDLKTRNVRDDVYYDESVANGPGK